MRLRAALERLFPALAGYVDLSADGRRQKSLLPAKKPPGQLEVALFYLTTPAVGHFGIIAELHTAKLNKRAVVVMHAADFSPEARGLKEEDVLKEVRGVDVRGDGVDVRGWCGC
eukprot:2544059-Pyramimonas_sp.AAC.1